MQQLPVDRVLEIIRRYNRPVGINSKPQVPPGTHPSSTLIKTRFHDSHQRHPRNIPAPDYVRVGLQR